MKYLKYLRTSNDFESFKNSEDYILPNVSYVEETKGVSYEPYVPDMCDNYLTIESLEDGLTASLSTNECEYCVDGDGNWKTLSADTTTESINIGQTLSFRGNLTPTSSIGIGTFSISKKCNLKGNCMSMLFGDNAADNYSLESKNFAFMELFKNCINIVNVSGNFLSATTLSSSCYYGMFYGCTSLTTAPELPATKLASNCYDRMFQDCTSLTAAPELPATTLANTCYNYMFYGCTSLTTAPSILPATKLASNCYYGMFQGCKALTTAPELPAPTLAYACYRAMFSGCTNLNYIKMLATDVSERYCLFGWVSGVASTGTFVKNGSMTTLPAGSSGIPEGWTVENYLVPINTNNYLTIESLEDGLTASLSINACEYCVDGDGNWKTLSTGTATESINSGQTLSFRGNLTPNSSNGIGKFTISKKCNLKGNCMSMLFGDNAADNFSLNGKDNAFRNLFRNCANIVNVSSNFLPATTLANNCYCYMFYSCRLLTTVPDLPATTLVDECYSGMFNGCTSLTTTPALPATTLAEYCYSFMFSDCTSLTTAPSILPATTLAIWCYQGMFNGCTALTTAPALPATTLPSNCYKTMFYGCTSLTTAPELPATSLAYECCYRMFSDCTSLTTAPELPATKLAEGCYKYMFNGCTNLNYIKMLATNTSANSCLTDWVSGVASTGTFVKNPAMSSLPTGTSGIPEGWTVVDAA